MFLYSVNSIPAVNIQISGSCSLNKDYFYAI